MAPDREMEPGKERSSEAQSWKRRPLKRMGAGGVKQTWGRTGIGRWRHPMEQKWARLRSKGKNWGNERGTNIDE